jgi:hypothetical protein
LLDGRGKKTNSVFHPGLYYSIARRTVHNIHYIANLIALQQWYRGVRFQFFQEDSMNRELYEGAWGKLDMAIDERINRLKALAYKMPQSAKLYQKIMKGRGSQRLVMQKKELFDKWKEIEDMLFSLRDKMGEASDRDAFLETVAQGREEKGNDYIKVIQGLDRKSCARGTTWLQGIVDEINRKVLEKIPSFKDQT